VEIRADGGQAELDLQPGEDGSGTGRRAGGRGKRPRRTDGRVDGSLRPRMGTARTALTGDGCCCCDEDDGTTPDGEATAAAATTTQLEKGNGFGDGDAAPRSKMKLPGAAQRDE